MSVEYAIIVRNKTRLEALIDQFNTKAQAKFYIESLGGNFDDYVIEHDRFYFSLNQVQTLLSTVLKNKIVDRSYLPNYIFSDNNIIIVIGQDGLVANTAKYSNGIPIIAINPDPQRYDGVLLPFSSKDFIYGIEQVVNHKHRFNTMQFAQAELNDGERLLAFNDLFIGASSHVSASYKISYNDQTEEHSSSGLLVSTKAGATGWLSSVFNMAYGITSLFDRNLPRHHPELCDNDLMFTVREPFQSKRTQADITAAFITQQQQLILESLMPNHGVIFSDGIESDFLKFNSGAIAKISLATEQAYLVMNERK